jgi:putative hydrolase of the HAD superfamily
MAAQGSPGAVRAVLLDALGTLLELCPPAPRLRAALRDHAGLAVDEATAARAIAAEIRFYRAHLHEGGTPDGLARLRARCAEIVRDELGDVARAVPAAALLAALLAALEFRAFPDAAPTLRELRARGVRLVVVSNWDVSLHERLAETGLAALVDGAVASAEIGAAKPDPAIFRRALELAGGMAAAEALHAGDSLDADVEGARAAGLRAVLVARGGAPAPAGVASISSLAELPGLLA